MQNNAKSIVILMADDDYEDRMMVKDAWEESRLCNDLRFVEDGVELMDYLERRGKYTDPSDSPRPGLILLDLNMPKMDGREALQAIKASPNLRLIPVVIMTTSRAEDDIMRSYDVGANSYITKPVSFEGLVQVVRQLETYWFNIVELPLAERRLQLDGLIHP